MVRLKHARCRLKYEKLPHFISFLLICWRHSIRSSKASSCMSNDDCYRKIKRTSYGSFWFLRQEGSTNIISFSTFASTVSYQFKALKLKTWDAWEIPINQLVNGKNPRLTAILVHQSKAVQIIGETRHKHKPN